MALFLPECLALHAHAVTHQEVSMGLFPIQRSSVPLLSIHPMAGDPTTDFERPNNMGVFVSRMSVTYLIIATNKSREQGAGLPLLYN